MERRIEKDTPTSIEPEAIGFEPAKYILKTVYTKIFNNVPHPSTSSSSSSTSTSTMSSREAHYRAVHDAIRNTVKNVKIPINVLVGRSDANESEQTQLERLGFSKVRENRLRDFQLLNPDIPIDDSLDLYSNCSNKQCFLYIETRDSLFNHFSMPANPIFGKDPEDHYKIHFKEDIPQGGSGIFHYEYVPFDGQGQTTINRGSNGPVFPNQPMVLSDAEAQERERQSTLTPTELGKAEKAKQAAKQATTKAPKQLTPEEEEKKRQAAIRKQKAEATEAAQQTINTTIDAAIAASAARQKALEEETRKKAEDEAEAARQAAIQQREEEVKRIREKQARGEELTDAERTIIEPPKTRADQLRGFFAARKKKGGRLTRRRPRRRALRKTRRV